MNQRGEMTVHFWGVRGSYPVPGASTIRYGGNTACVEVEVDGTTIILDAGTGIAALGHSLARRARAQGRSVNCLLLLSHLHHDHTQGFPFFTPVYIPSANLVVYGPDFHGFSTEATLEEVMQPPFFPVKFSDLNANLTLGTLRNSSALLVENGVVTECSAQEASAAVAAGDPRVVIRVMRSYAHPGGVLHYRIDYQGTSLVYATDTEGYVSGDRRLATFARDVDLLIHDAQYTDEHYLGLAPGLSVTQGYGHSTVSMACQAAANAGARQLALFHHAPEYNDDQLDEIVAKASRLLPGVFAATEGAEVRLGGQRQMIVLESIAQQSSY